jgi:ribonuclease HI/pterin-4a-carbinolamine dehydratase
MWQNTENKLYKKFEFNDFKEAFDFMHKVATLAERQNHHPTITNTYNQVEIWLSTHSAGDVITEKDEAMAKLIDQLLPVAEPIEEVEQLAEAIVGPAISIPKEIKLFGDGGSRGNPGPSASGYVLLDMDNNILFKTGVYLGITTNNQAEYQALKFGLEEALKLGAREVNVHMDSLLVINQMKGVFKVKNRDLWPIHESIKETATKFKRVTYTHVPRELNKLADAEVNTTLDAEVGR